MWRKTGLLVTILLLTCLWTNAQVITGKIVADSTETPIAATLITQSAQTTSNNNGEFSVRVSGVGDTIRVFAMGYKPLFYPVRSTKQEHLVIHLKPNTILLNDVLIKAERNHQKDSLDRRRDYSQVFNYQPPKVKDAFIAPPSNVPFAFISVDLLTLLNSLTKNSDPKYKFQKLLLKDEQADYAAGRFSRGLVTRTTGLKGDSLNMFMDKYYPAVEWVRKASDYDIVVYIKTKAAEFRKPHN